jgi:hypothetical protein
MCNNFRIAATTITLPFLFLSFNLSPNNLIIGLKRNADIAGIYNKLRNGLEPTRDMPPLPFTELPDSLIAGFNPA